MPDRITSTTHAMALGMYLAITLVGASIVLGENTLPGATRLYGETVASGMGWATMIGAGAALILAATSQRWRRPTIPLRLEAWACIVCAVAWGLYWYSIAGRAVMTELLAVGVALACVARAVQAWRDLSKISP